MDNVVEEIKKKIDIIEYIGGFVSLKKTGRNFKGLCPFHQEKTASFVISPDRQIWHCFGACGEGGDIIKFLMKWENITFIEALKELADRAGIKINKISFEDKTWEKKQSILKINNLASDFFEYILQKSRFGEKAKDYLKSRKINSQIIKKFQLGYSPRSWDSLAKFFSSKKFDKHEVNEAGLLVSRQNDSFYDRFRGRLMFPIKDPRNNIIGFSGRVIEGNEKEAKYINTPETPVYHKRETLFGINLAKESIKKEKNAILVEGEFDMIMPFQNGIENIVAIKGSAVTREQLGFIKRYTDKVTLALDTDAAGIQAMKRGIEETENFELEVNVLKFDYAKDPDEAVRLDLSKFKNALKKPVPIYDFFIDEAINNSPEDDPFSKKKVVSEILPLMDRISNPIVQSYYLKKLSKTLDVDENNIRLMMGKYKYKTRKPEIYRTIKKKLDIDQRNIVIQKYVLSLVLQNRSIINRVFSIIDTHDFSIVSYQKIANLFISFVNEKKQAFDINEFINLLPKELIPVFDETYLYSAHDLGLENQKIEKLAYEIKRDSLKRQISTMLKLESEDQKQNEKLKELNLQLKEVEKKHSPL